MNIQSKIIPLTVPSETQKLRGKISAPVLETPSSFILFLGALRRYKGLQTLIDAARISNRMFIIAGVGEEEIRLKSSVSSHGLKNVIFLGSVSESEKHYLLNKCHFLCLPSDRKSEAFGVVLLEAFSAGKCVLTSNLNTGMAFVNKHGQTGRVFKAGDAEHMNKQIEYLYNNPADYERYCINASKASNTKFSPQVLDSYLQIYNSLASN